MARSARLSSHCLVLGFALSLPSSVRQVNCCSRVFSGCCHCVRVATVMSLLRLMQVICNNRTLYNCRNGWDIARFLADATPEDVEAHLFNLR